MKCKTNYFESILQQMFLIKLIEQNHKSIEGLIIAFIFNPQKLLNERGPSMH